MDLILEIADALVLDKVYAQLVPLAAFIPAKAVNSTSATSTATWSRLVSQLPHPPLPLGDQSLYTASPSAIPPISAWPRDYVLRELASISVLTLAGIFVLYFVFAGLSYRYIFDHNMMRHPRFLKNQVKLEIQTSMRGFPGMTLLTIPWFLGEVWGYSKLYDDVDTYGWPYLFATVLMYLVFTDFCIYWLHRWLHIPFIYKNIHKPHHKWIIPTPFASHAFHPLDGYIQSLPYHIFIFLVPMHRVLYLVLFVLVNFWSIFIHDSEMATGLLTSVINGASHHTLHHIYFTVNYGQYFTWADRAGGSYRHPDPSLDPLLAVHAHDEEMKKMTLGKDQ